LHRPGHIALVTHAFQAVFFWQNIWLFCMLHLQLKFLQKSKCEKPRTANESRAKSAESRWRKRTLIVVTFSPNFSAKKACACVWVWLCLSLAPPPLFFVHACVCGRINLPIFRLWERNGWKKKKRKRGERNEEEAKNSRTFVEILGKKRKRKRKNPNPSFYIVHVCFCALCGWLCVCPISVCLCAF